MINSKGQEIYTNNEEICGKCIHHRKQNEEWVCVNPESECYGCWTEYRDGCDEFEDRVNSGFSVTVVKKSKKS